MNLFNFLASLGDDLNIAIRILDISVAPSVLQLVSQSILESFGIIAIKFEFKPILDKLRFLTQGQVRIQAGRSSKNKVIGTERHPEAGTASQRVNEVFSIALLTVLAESPENYSSRELFSPGSLIGHPKRYTHLKIRY